MTADIAHELRTPLSVMQANLEAMADGLLPVDAQEIASLHDETLLLTRLVSDLRLLSLAEAGQLKLERVPTDLGELVRRVIEPLHVQSENSDIDLTVEIAPDIPTVAVDADRIAQVLVNLVHNALRYTPAGGRITVRAVSHREDDAEAETGLAAQVEVVDTGSGIAADELPFVFDRFYRVDRAAQSGQRWLRHGARHSPAIGRGAWRAHLGDKSGRTGYNGVVCRALRYWRFRFADLTVDPDKGTVPWRHVHGRIRGLNDARCIRMCSSAQQPN